MTTSRPVPAELLGRVLRPEQFLTRARFASAAPEPVLQPWVERYWSVSWNLGAGEAFTAATTFEPAVNLTVERGGIVRDGSPGHGAWITGPVSAGRFAATLSGEGAVIGVKFTLGGIRAFAAADDLDLAALRDRTVQAARVFTVPDIQGDAVRAAPLLDEWLTSHRPTEPDGLATVRHLMTLLDDPSVTSVGALSERSGRSLRAIQRDLRSFVGVGPKRMLMRARVRDALAALDRGDAIDLARLAAELGWFDQAHFIRDFRAVTGTTPAAYRATRS